MESDGRRERAGRDRPSVRFSKIILIDVRWSAAGWVWGGCMVWGERGGGLRNEISFEP